MRLPKQRGYLVGGGLVAVAMSIATPAVSQEAGGERGSGAGARETLAEVVVTAQKRSENLQEVPVPVTAIGADVLARQNQTRLTDYFASVPGFNLNSQGNGQTNIAIRGITTGSLTSPAVGVTIDDVPYGSTSVLGYGGRLVPDIDPSDLERVEVLRGPQGTLYGASSMGGLLKFVTVDPSTSGLSGRVQASLNSVSHSDGEMGYGVRAAVNIPVSDTLAVRASGFTRRDPGYVFNIATGEPHVNDLDVKGGRLSALWRPTENFSAKLGVLLQDATAGGTGQIDTDSRLRPTLGDLVQNRLRGTQGYDAGVRLYSATLVAKLGFADLTSVSGYGINTYRGTVDSSLAFGQSYGVPFFGTPGVSTINDFRTKKFTQELRLASSGEQRIDWLLGAFYTHEDTPATQILAAVDPATGANLGTIVNSPFPTTFAEYAVFGDVTVHFTDRFDVQVGGRESQNRQAYSEIDTGPLVGGVFENPPQHTKDNAFTYLFSPRYKLSANLMAYLRLASGYRAGGPNPDAGLFNLPAAFKPDKTVSYEAGLKGYLFDRALSYDASVFYIDWKNIQLQLRDPQTGFAFFTNAGKAKSEGIELSMQARPVHGMSVSFSGSFNDAALVQDLPPGAGFGFSGNRLPFSARFSGNLAVDQDLVVVDEVTAYAGASMAYVGDRFVEFPASAQFVRARMPAYTQLNLHAGIRYSGWNTNLYLNNVTDRRGIIGAGSIVQSGGTASDPFYATYIQPRTVGLAISKDF